MKYLMSRGFLTIVGMSFAFACDDAPATGEEWLGEMIMVKETATPQVGTRRFKFSDIAVPAEVAYAELRDFEAAVRWQTSAIAMSRLANERDLRDDLKRLELYKSGKPYYEDVPPPSDDAKPLNEHVIEPGSPGRERRGSRH